MQPDRDAPATASGAGEIAPDGAPPSSAVPTPANAMRAEPPAEPVEAASAPADPAGSSAPPADEEPGSAEPASPGPGEAPEGPAAAEDAAEDVAAPSVIDIERARWSEEDALLEVRGEVSSLVVTLTVSFLGRTEALGNDAGTFRGEFSGVAEQPLRVTITASDGASAQADVEADLEDD
jgi:hypothetical protein